MVNDCRSMSPKFTRFVEAQASFHDLVVSEIIACRKRAHWMWFTFPQLRGLGQSRNALLYGIRDLSEARAYLAHPLLGDRLRQLVVLVGTSHATPEQLFGPDVCKYRSCLTLFALAQGELGVFECALADQLAGVRCKRTPELLASCVI